MGENSYEGGRNENGQMEGEGKLTYWNGDVYEGNYKDDVKNGFGKYYYSETKNRYEGEWVNGKKEGKGVFIWSNGDKYEGQFLKDNKHGKGKLTHNSGDVYGIYIYILFYFFCFYIYLTSSSFSS